MAKCQYVITNNPPGDGREWDCQCARCGSSCEFVDCPDCDDGYIEVDYGDDVVSDMQHEVCPYCKGYGGWWRCLSSPDWCNGNPLDDRQDVSRGKIEWYTFDPKVG